MSDSDTILLMDRVKRGVTHLLGIVLLLSLLGAAYSISFNRTLGDADNVKQLLADSKVYDRISGSLLAKSQDETNQGAGDTSVAFTDPAIQQAASQAFSAPDLQKNAETFIDANYAWLAGKTDKPAFNLDLSDSKQNFAERVGQYVTQRLAGLPVCTPEQTAQLQIPVDPLTANCRPEAINPQAEGTRITQEINNGNFLSQSVITADTFNRDPNSQQTPYYQNLSSAPTFFQLAQKGPLIAGILALLSAATIIFLSSVKRKGWRKVGIILLIAGVVLIGTKLVADTIVNRLDNRVVAQSASATQELDQARDKVLAEVKDQLTQTNITFGAVFLALSAVILIYLLATRNKTAKPSAPAYAEPPQASQKPRLDEAYLRDRSRPARPNQDIADPRDRLQPRPVGDPQRPPRKKPPRLIQ